jgi:ferredoxin
MVKVTVDKDSCIGCGACAAIAPDIFVMEGGKSKVKKAAPSDAALAKEASDSCPVSCISVK